MKFSIKDFASKCDQIRSFLWIWSHLLKKSLMENFIFFVQWKAQRTVSCNFFYMHKLVADQANEIWCSPISCFLVYNLIWNLTNQNQVSVMIYIL